MRRLEGGERSGEGLVYQLLKRLRLLEGEICLTDVRTSDLGEGGIRKGPFGADCGAHWARNRQSTISPLQLLPKGGEGIGGGGEEGERWMRGRSEGREGC